MKQKDSSPFQELLRVIVEYSPAPGYSVAGADLIKALRRHLRKLKGGSV